MVFRRINRKGRIHTSVHSRYLWVALVLAVGFASVFYLFPDNGDEITGAAYTDATLSKTSYSFDECGTPGRGHTFVKGGLAIVCANDNNGRVCNSNTDRRTVQFSAYDEDVMIICDYNNGNNPRWVECDFPGGNWGTFLKGSAKGSLDKGELFGDNHYICYASGPSSREFIKVCPGSLKVIGDDDVTTPTADQKKSLYGYSCTDNEWKVTSGKTYTSNYNKMICLDKGEGYVANDNNGWSYLCDHNYDHSQPNEVNLGRGIICNQNVGRVEWSWAGIGNLEDDVDYKTHYLCQNNGWVECDSEGNGKMNLESQGTSVGDGDTLDNGHYLCASGSGVTWGNPYAKSEYIFVCPENYKKDYLIGLSDNNHNGRYVKWSEHGGKIDTTQGQYICDGDTFNLCDGEKITQDNKRVCDNDEWKSCKDLDQETLMGNDKFYCPGGDFEQWIECGNDNNNHYSEDFQYQCQNNKWHAVGNVNPPDGYWYTQAPVASSLDGATCNLINTKYWVDNSFNDAEKAGCCPQADMCVKKSNDKCYFSGSLVKGGSDFSHICGNEKFNEQDTPTWIWCSEDLEEDKILYLDDKYLCQEAVDSNNVEGWLVCNQENKGRAANIDLGSDFDLNNAEVTDNSLLKYYCDGTKWIECNTENLGFATGDEEYVCSQKNPFWWANLLPLNKQGLFEIRISESDPDKIVPLDTVGMHSNPDTSVYSEVNLCDDGTEHVSFKATLCYIDHPHLPDDFNHNNDQDVKVIISSNQFLQGTNELMKTMEEDNVLYMFEESEGEKTVSMFPVLEPDVMVNEEIDGVMDTHSPFLSVGILATNFKQGRRLAMEVDGVHYLLKHPPEDLDINKFSILEVPSGETIPVNKLSSTKHQFIIQALKVIALEIIDDEVHFNIEQPLEAVAGQVDNHDLSKEFEVSFDRESPVRLIDFVDDVGNNPIYSVCIKDNSADPNRMLICKNDAEFATLHRGEPTFKEIGTADFGDNIDGAFFKFDLEDGKKVARIYYTKLLNENNIEIDYNDFINSMVAGKRIALTTETVADLTSEGSDALYLLTHPVQQFISLPDLELVQITELGETLPSPFIGSFKKAQSLVEAGRLTIKQENINPPPPFILEWENKNEVIDEEINLNQQFFTQVKSNFPTKIVMPNFGVIHVHDNDVVKSAMSFRLNTETELGELLATDLLRLPLVTDNLMDAVVVGENGNDECGGNNNPSCALFHYFSAQVLQGNFIKTAAIYKYLDISEKNEWRKIDFNDEFIDTFTGGSPIALGTEDMNYLVGYAAGVEGQQDFFKLEGIVLINLDGSIIYTKEVQNSESRVIFTVPDSEERIVVYVDDVNGEISFYSSTQNVLTGETFTDYAHFLTPDNSVKILGKTYQICDNPDFALFDESVLICESGNQFVVNKSDPLSIVTSEEVAPVMGQNLCGAVQMFGPGGLAVQELVAQVPFGGPIANPINPAAANNANPICINQQAQVEAE